MPKILPLAAAAGLVLRLVFAFAYWNDQPLTRDEQEYLSLARGLTAGRGFAPDTTTDAAAPDPFGRAPGYPAFLAVIGAGHAPASSTPAVVKIAQAVIGAIGVLLLGVVAARLAGSRAGAIAAWIAACYPPLVWVSAYVFSEAIFWPMGVACVWLFDRAVAVHNHDRRWLFIAGVAAGAASLVRPSMVVFVVLAAAWLASRRRVVPAMVLALGAALVIAPWTIRNVQHYGKFVLVATEGGVTFWTGNHPLAIGEGDLAANPPLKRAQLALRAAHPERTEEQMEPVYYEEAFAWMRAHPVDWLTLEIRKIFYLIVPIGPSYRLHSFRYYAASVVSYAIVLPLALFGAWRLGTRRARVPGLWLMLGSAVVTCLVFFPQERFRIPVIDPALIICAGACRLRAGRGPAELE